MKLFLRKKLALMFGVALLGCSGSVLAICLPNTCQQQYEDCVANGQGRCAIKYAQCMQAHGCIIP